MPRFAYVNGHYIVHRDAGIPIEDRGLQFADGIYEVIALIDGVMADERGHLDRMQRSLKELKMDMPMPRRALQMVMRELIRRNRIKNAAVYIQVTRGVAKRDFGFPSPAVLQTVIITTRPYKFRNNPRIEKGVRAITVPDIRWKRRDIKTTAMTAQVLARQEAIEKGGAEALMVDDGGYITEGAASNAWIVTKRGVLVTRPATHDILRGITRTALDHVRMQLSLKMEERSFTVNEAQDAAECFVTAATALVTPVTHIDGKKIGDGMPGSVAKGLYDAYLSYVKKGKQVAWKA